MPRSRAQRNYGGSSKKDDETPGWLKGIYAFLFLASLGTLVYWTIPQLKELLGNKVGSALSISSPANVEFPSITICNLEPKVSLRFQNCVLPDGSPCKGAVRNDTGDFYCQTFNYDYNNITVAEKPGLHSLYTVQFTINKALYPTNAGLFGAQIVLHEPGTQPDIEKNAIFIAPGQATIVTLRRTQTKHLNGDSLTLSWDASPSILAIDPTLFKYDELVVAGFMYRELSVLDIEEIELYTVGQFAGNFAGMVGTLLGLDALNLSIICVSAVFAFFAGKRKGEKGATVSEMEMGRYRGDEFDYEDDYDGDEDIDRMKRTNENRNDSNNNSRHVASNDRRMSKDDADGVVRRSLDPQWSKQPIPLSNGNKGGEGSVLGSARSAASRTKRESTGGFTGIINSITETYEAYAEALSEAEPESNKVSDYSDDDDHQNIPRSPGKGKGKGKGEEEGSGWLGLW